MNLTENAKIFNNRLVQSQSIAVGLEQNSGIPNSAILTIIIEKIISHIDACG